jgi:hypothetical protein
MCRIELLCRSLTYVTATLQGTLDHLPGADGTPTIPTVSLLFGIAGLSDSGAPSDERVPGAHCPR